MRPFSLSISNWKKVIFFTVDFNCHLYRFDNGCYVENTIYHIFRRTIHYLDHQHLFNHPLTLYSAEIPIKQ